MAMMDTFPGDGALIQLQYWNDPKIGIIFADCGEVTGELKLPFTIITLYRDYDGISTTTYESDILSLGTGSFAMGLSGSSIDRTVFDEWGNSFKIIGSIWQFETYRINTGEELILKDY